MACGLGIRGTPRHLVIHAARHLLILDNLSHTLDDEVTLSPKILPVTWTFMTHVSPRRPLSGGSHSRHLLILDNCPHPPVTVDNPGSDVPSYATWFCAGDPRNWWILKTLAVRRWSQYR